MAYEKKTISDVIYEVRFATFRPKTRAEAAKAMELEDNDKNNIDILDAFNDGIAAEALVPVVKSISDILNLSENNTYTEEYLVSCFTHGIAIKEQAKSRQTLENLARPKSSRLTEKRYSALFLKLTPDDWNEIANAQGETTKADVLKKAITRLHNETI